MPKETALRLIDEGTSAILNINFYTVIYLTPTFWMQPLVALLRKLFEFINFELLLTHGLLG